MKTIIAVLAMALTLSACGGGGGGGVSPVAAVTKVIKPVIIDAEGDSTIYGYEFVNGAYIQTPNNAPVLLQAALRAKLGSGITVENKGVGGGTASGSVAGTGVYTVLFATRLAVDPSQIVLSNYALNDMIGRTQDQYAGDLAAWVQVVRAAGKTPVLEEPNPGCTANQANLDAYVGTLRTVAQQQGVLLISQYDAIKALPNWQSMLTDCVHPGDALYAFKANREYLALAPLVQSMQ